MKKRHVSKEGTITLGCLDKVYQQASDVVVDDSVLNFTGKLPLTLPSPKTLLECLLLFVDSFCCILAAAKNTHRVTRHRHVSCIQSDLV